MKTTAQSMVVETSSEPAIVLEAKVTRAPSVSGTPAEQIAAMNGRMNADADRLTRLARANTRRLSGKPNL